VWSSAPEPRSHPCPRSQRQTTRQAAEIGKNYHEERYNHKDGLPQPHKISAQWSHAETRHARGRAPGH
jgi:hypothetical protein